MGIKWTSGGKQHVLRGDIALKSEKSYVKAVTFDLWETLLFERDGASSLRTAARCRNLAQALNKFGLRLSVGQVEEALKETISSLLKVWEKNKDVTHLDQIRLFVKYASRGGSVLKEELINELSMAYVLPIFEVPPHLNPDALEVLQWLKNQGKLIGIICNTGLTPGTELRRLLDKEGATEYFDLMIFSDEVRVRKPDPRIFHIAALRLKSEPKEVVHVGDNLKADVWGAKNAGFKAIHLSGDAGRDKLAESDPTSLVSLSRSLGNAKLEHATPDRAVTSLAMVKEAIMQLEATA
jgi:putative hydrolase of the HAD superfamily